MPVGRTILTATLAVSLAACGGGGDSSPSGPVVGGGSSGGGGNTTCSLSARQDWARDVLNEWYLFPDLLNLNVNKAQYSDVQSYIDALVAQAAAQNKDRGFTYLTSIQEENEALQGSRAGLGIRLTTDGVSRLFAAEVYETGPAFDAGFDRGTEILSINGQSVEALFQSGGTNAVLNALGPSDPGVRRDFTIRGTDGVTRNVSVTKADYTLDPISDRYGVVILNDGTDNVAYINLRTFFSQDADPQLRAAFQQLKAQGITKIILDLRYNGGGLVDVANTLGDLMAEGLEGQVFSKTVLRPSKSAENSTELFQNIPEQIAVTKLAVIGTRSTASASELVTNSFIPYLGENLALVGSNTFGKPVGQFAFDRSACDDRLRAVTFKTVNANDQGEYFDGLASVVQKTCAAPDNIFEPLGDPAEPSISAALDFMAGRSCTSITGVQSAQSSTSKRRLLVKDRPSEFERTNPGLY
ncbi:S41 family peptidase [Qipengyuania nanhaisediminis]|uniref:Peptidase family S41 n=1 Tax=Qipengyuania nanhaisediminis TaxID=604088 RepID=A0A1I5LB33_9SPHN|nr:S41 family peptidase [Qipengyuania nanhaisediminis]SFO94584.1 Peptidase family S41 [Qipengyuania nanhaisediminis]